MGRNAHVRTPVKFPRLAVMSAILVASTVLVATQSHAVTTAPTNGQPLYQFAETGTGTFPWSAASLEAKLNSTTMLGGPHGATSSTEGALAYRTNANQLALYVQTNAGNTAWRNYSTGNDVPVPADDPVPFFDPSGNVDIVYVDANGQAILVVPNEPDTTAWARAHYGTPWRKYVSINLSALTDVAAATGLPSAQVVGDNATLAYRTTTNEIEVVTMSWTSSDPIPIYNQASATVNYQGLATSVSVPQDRTPNLSPRATTTTTTTKPTTTTSTTTTTVPPTVATGFASDPVVIPGATPAFADILNNGDVVVDTEEGSLVAWSSSNLTLTLGTPVATGTLALGASAAQVDFAALTTGGSVELFTSISSGRIWNESNVTTLAAGAPPLSGALSVQVTPSQVAIAGQAANWGDLYVLTSPTESNSWTATNVSTTAGSDARTVGPSVTGLQINGTLTLYAAGVNSPPPQGVGVYAIPSADWTQRHHRGMADPVGDRGPRHAQRAVGRLHGFVQRRCVP